MIKGWARLSILMLVLVHSAIAQAQTCLTTSTMSFNIRYGETGLTSIFDTNGWNKLQNPRRQRVINTVRQSLPDIVGLQEVLDFQLNDLKAALPEYEVWAAGRDDGKKKGEAVPLFFKRSRFLKEESGHFWLSETPESPGTVFDGSGSIRMASWIRIFDRDCQVSLFVLNSHWDNVSQSARERSSTLIRQRLEQQAGTSEVIVLGDLNTTEFNPAVKNLLAPGTDLALMDAFRRTNPSRTENEATFHDYTGRIQGERIDFILLSERLRPLQSSIRRDTFSGLYPSDHYAVETTFAHDNDPPQVSN